MHSAGERHHHLVFGSTTLSSFQLQRLISNMGKDAGARKAGNAKSKAQESRQGPGSKGSKGHAATDTLQGMKGRKDSEAPAPVVEEEEAVPTTASTGLFGGIMDAEPFQQLGGLAREMEDQLMQEFESLMARKQQKGNRAAGGDGSEPASMEESGLGEDAEDGTRNAAYWKCMYERLRDVRETEAEKLLREMSVHAEQREALMQDLMRQLKEWGGKPDLSAAKPAEAESEGSEGVDMVAQKEVELRDTRIAELEAKVMRLKRLVLGYQRLTSLCVAIEEPTATDGAMDVEEDDKLSTLTVTAINHMHKRAVKFQVELDCDHDDGLERDANYRPVANKAHLPQYLRQELTLETKQCPMLLLSVLRSLYTKAPSEQRSNNATPGPRQADTAQQK